MVNSAVIGTGYSATAPTEAQVFRARAGYVGNGTKTGILAFHSAGAKAASSALYWPTISTYYPLIQSYLADCGWPILNTDLGNDPWCNDVVSPRGEEARAFLQAAPQGAKSGKVIVLGWSEGGANAMKYTLDNPTRVAAMILLQPASDLQDFVTNNRSGFASQVNAAYSGGYSDATYGAAHNPKLFAPALAANNIPAWIAYASDDAAVIPSTVASVVTSLGATATVGLLSVGGHGDGFLSKLLAADGSSPDIARWLTALGL